MFEHVVAPGDAIQLPSSSLKLLYQLSALHRHLLVWIARRDDGCEVIYHAMLKMYLELCIRSFAKRRGADGPPT